MRHPNKNFSTVLVSAGTHQLSFKKFAWMLCIFLGLGCAIYLLQLSVSCSILILGMIFFSMKMVAHFLLLLFAVWFQENIFLGFRLDTVNGDPCNGKSPKKKNIAIVVGIIVSVVVVLGLVCSIGMFIFCRRRPSQRKPEGRSFIHSQLIFHGLSMSSTE